MLAKRQEAEKTNKADSDKENAAAGADILGEQEDPDVIF